MQITAHCSMVAYRRNGLAKSDLDGWHCHETCLLDLGRPKEEALCTDRPCGEMFYSNKVQARSLRKADKFSLGIALSAPPK